MHDVPAIDVSRSRCTSPDHVAGRGCPSWCVECDHDSVPPGGFVHSGPSVRVPLYGDGCDLVEATVYASFFDVPVGSGDPKLIDLERPTVRIEIEDNYIDLTPAQARQFAQAISRAADTCDG